MVPNSSARSASPGDRHSPSSATFTSPCRQRVAKGTGRMTFVPSTECMIKPVYTSGGKTQLPPNSHRDQLSQRGRALFIFQLGKADVESHPALQAALLTPNPLLCMGQHSGGNCARCWGQAQRRKLGHGTGNPLGHHFPSPESFPTRAQQDNAALIRKREAEELGSAEVPGSGLERRRLPKIKG